MSDTPNIENWLTTKQAQKRLEARGITMTISALLTACKEERLKAVKIGDKYRGIWKIDPASVDTFEKHSKPPRE